MKQVQRLTVVVMILAWASPSALARKAQDEATTSKRQKSKRQKRISAKRRRPTIRGTHGNAVRDRLKRVRGAVAALRTGSRRQGPSRGITLDVEPNDTIQNVKDSRRGITLDVDSSDTIETVKTRQGPSRGITLDVDSSDTIETVKTRRRPNRGITLDVEANDTIQNVKARRRPSRKIGTTRR